MLALTPGRRRHGVNLRSSRRLTPDARQERARGASPRRSAPCPVRRRRAESQKVLCRFRWQTSAPIAAGLREADLRVHVRAVHVDLAAVLVDDRADVAGCRPRTRRASTDRSPSAPPAIVACLCRLRRRDRRRRCCRSRAVATTTTLHARHHRAGGIRAVRRCRNQARRSRCVVAADPVIRADRPAGRRTPLARRSWAAATPRRTR